MASEVRQHLNRSTPAILTIARDVLGKHDVAEITRRVLEVARDFTGAAYAAFGVIGEQDPERLSAPRLAEFIPVGIDERTRRGLELPIGLGVLAELIHNPVPLRLADLSSHPRSYGFPPGHPQMRTFLGVPVFVDGRPFGNIYLTEKAGEAEFTQEDEQTIVALAELAGAAIGSAERLTTARERREELERAVARLEATTRITDAIGDETNLDVILELVAKRGRALVAARVLLIELRYGEELVIAAAAGEAPPGLVGKRIPLEGAFVEQAIRDRHEVRVEDERSLIHFNQVGVGLLGVRAEAGLVVPLVFRDHAFGALIAVDRQTDGPAFSIDDAQLLDAFATSAATAVAVAQSVAADAERLASVVRSSTDAIVTLDTAGVVTSWNPGAEKLYGFTAEEIIGRPASSLVPALVPQESSDEIGVLPRVMNGEVVNNIEASRARPDGSPLEVSISGAAIFGPEGETTGLAFVMRDITQLKQTQRTLAQTERLESIGQLAGGIAHDMNNLLTIILNHTDFAIASLSEDDPSREDIFQAHAAADRAAALIRQLLVFAREDPGAVEMLDVNQVVTGVVGMLGRTLGEHIELRTELTEEPRSVEADRGQVEQVLLNLAVNSRDAMPDGGTLTISATDVTLDAAQIATHTVQGRAGRHVRLAVSDTGVGMTPDVIAKAIDPFFSTKPAGEGTGLGLATVYGILTKAGGHMHIASEPGHGTTIETYWPAAETTGDEATVMIPDSAQAQPNAAGYTILVVEDEPALRQVAKRILERQGYTVLTAAQPSEAVELSAAQHAAIDLMITDVVMPGASGPQLAAELQSARGELPVLYTSGYVPDAGALPAGADFLPKPFTGDQLLAAVAHVLVPRGS